MGKGPLIVSLVVLGSLVIFSGCASYSSRGAEKMEQGDYEGAIKDYTKAIQNSSDPIMKASSYTNRAWAKSKMGDADGARKDIQQAKRLIPQKFEGNHFNLALVSGVFLTSGLIKKRNEEYEKAMKDFNKAKDLAPDETGLADVFMNRGDLKKEMGDLDKAIKDYNSAIELTTKSVWNQSIVSENLRAMAHKRRGDAKHEKGDDDGAVKDWKKALEIGSSEWDEGKRNQIKEKIQKAEEKK